MGPQPLSVDVLTRKLRRVPTAQLCRQASLSNKYLYMYADYRISGLSLPDIFTYTVHTAQYIYIDRPLGEVSVKGIHSTLSRR